MSLFLPLALAGAAVLAGLAWLLGFRAAPQLGPGDAARLANDALTGFDAVDIAVAADGRAALLGDAGGGVVLVRGHGDRWIVRRLARGRAQREGSRLTLAQPDAPRLTLDLGDAAERFATRLR